MRKLDAHRALIYVHSGNLEGDVQILATDIEYARRLTKADILLWWTSSDKADLGGRQHDNFSSDAAEHLPEVIRPGAFTNASIEIRLDNLATDAVMQSALVYELEGADATASIALTEGTHNLDEYAKGTAHAGVILGDTILPTQVFAVVKAMVKAWYTAGSATDGMHARRSLDAFWRWATSPSSALYDPALERFVLSLMRKTFSQLLAEFKRLGSDVVYANYNRLMLMTNKPTPAAAYAYANYIVSSVTSRELFKYVDLTIVNFWEVYLQVDASNFGGVICVDPLVEPDFNGKPPRIEMTWLIQALLAPALRPHFAAVIAAFIQGLREMKLRTTDDRTPLRVLTHPSQTQPDPRKKDEVESARTFATVRMTRLMLKTVEYVRKEHSHAMASGDPALKAAMRFPQFPGSHLATSKVVLEFIKAVCAVLALAKDIQPEMAVLRKNCLDMIGVREFATEAAFKQPSTSFKIPLTCQHCQTSREVDLAKDPELLLSHSIGTTSTLPCTACRHAMDKSLIEGHLISILNKQTIATTLQDLRCQRCNQVKSTSLVTLCPCSGAYKLDPSLSDIKRKIRTIRDLAEFYSFSMALELAEDMLQH